MDHSQQLLHVVLLTDAVVAVHMCCTVGFQNKKSEHI